MNQKIYDPISVANAFIEKACSDGAISMTHMKLQKLIYLTLEEWLKSKDKSFLSRDPEVWQYGPVFSDLYHRLKQYKSENILEPLSSDFGQPPNVDDRDLIECIEAVWNKYKSFSATRLSDISHDINGPWYAIAKKHSFQVPLGTIIPSNLIKDYVRRKT